MKTLAIDTSNQILTVTTADYQTKVATDVSRAARSHSMTLLPAIQQVVAASHWQLTDLERIVVADGPGSFTGLRIAVTVAKTLAVTLGIPVMTVSSLATLAYQADPANHLVVAVMDARNQNVFAGAYHANEQVISDQNIGIDQL